MKLLPLLEMANPYEEETMQHKVYALMDELELQYPITLWLSLSMGGIICVGSIIIKDKKDRNKGIGTKVMREICDFADTNNLRVALTPSNDFGGSVTRLKKFYAKFGFKRYKGFDVRQTMMREPDQ
jgi:GNAT superfamily N-acetyltransferase